jgi:endo-1,4-beta-xylanase
LSTPAHAADPNAVLYLNDWGIYEIGATKSEFFYNLVMGMRDRGVPIGGVGFEFHLIYPPDPWNTPGLADLDGFFSRVDQNIKRYAEAGFQVMFTEVECQVRMDDLDLSTQAGRDELARRQDKQAEIYARIMRLAVDNPNVAFITFWSLADLPGTSAFGPPFYELTYTDAFLFDKNYDPKPAYYAVLDVLMGR